jgi:hypothetical protein
VTKPEELDARARLIRAAVGFCLVPPTEPDHDASFIDHRCCGRGARH